MAAPFDGAEARPLARAMRVTDRQRSAQPYSASLLNISAMSYGALSANAIRALNKGAKRAGSFMTPAKAASRPITANSAAIWSGSSARAISAAGPTTAAFIRNVLPRPRADPQIKMVELKLSPGGQARPWRRVARSQGDGGNRRDPGRADGAGLRLARQPFGFQHPDRAAGIRRADARSVGRQAGRLQAVHRPPVGIHGDLQGDAGHRHHPRFHRDRRQRGRHRCGPAGVHGSCRHAAARWADLCP